MNVTVVGGREMRPPLTQSGGRQARRRRKRDPAPLATLTFPKSNTRTAAAFFAEFDLPARRRGDDGSGRHRCANALHGRRFDPLSPGSTSRSMTPRLGDHATRRNRRRQIARQPTKLIA
ncbi:hypothetical protein [Mycobacterium genavense]|uniref:hypothetical protein n=1 Tax=Mycobacterium genavense TaxID=36812 RepID=UPI0004718803|nr:hypothetical protein [Mycobacterium genavense]